MITNNEVINKYEKLKETLQEMEPDVIKFESGNKAAGTRLRKFCQEGKTIFQDIRKTVQELKNQPGN